MSERIRTLIEQFVADYPLLHGTKTRWHKPLVAFADARDERIRKLRSVVHPEHFMPDDILTGAKTIVSYFLPFEVPIVKSNIGGSDSSMEWDYAYVETNALLNDLNRFSVDALHKDGHGAAFVAPERIFDQDVLLGRWSHRHIAVIAGLGTFGLNNMLITDKGCCGRTNSFVTDIVIEPSPGIHQENCLFKFNGNCKKCMKHCVGGALTQEGFDRFKCDEQLQRNRKTYEDIGSVGVCGKCLVGLPCSLATPVKSQKN